jgi:ABC-type sugar transport system ATPase subunit
LNPGSAYGEVLAIVGENGAGRSTLITIMTGILAPTSGEVLVGSDQVHLESVEQARDHGVVLISQEPAHLPDDTIADDVSIGAWAARGG